MLFLLTTGGQPITTRAFQRSFHGALGGSVAATHRPLLARPLTNRTTPNSVLSTLKTSNPAHQRGFETEKRRQNAIHMEVRLPVVKRSLYTSRISRNTLQPNTSPIPLTYLSSSPRRLRRLRNLLILLSLLSILYYTYPPFRHTAIAVVRCARVMKAVSIDVWDYKQVFAAEERLGASGKGLTDEEIEIKRKARRACHKRSAERLLEALKKNSGIYVKLGQHVAAVQVLPKEWTETMRPLQDQCFPTPVQRTDEMLRADLGMGIDDMFTDFEPNPIGVASLAQVHRGVDKRTGRAVAVKVQHADLQEFAAVDMATVNFAIHFVKYVFPDFEFSWLGEEMNEMLPLEMDFRHEAANSARCMGDFLHLKGKTSLYLPEVFWAERRCMVMEFIEGGRVDDLMYLKKHKIDRNQVSQELARIFSQMVYINGYFHADPHHGNLLIRPKASGSTSPFNFDVCLLDHGQYFDVPDDLRVNYAHFWLSLIKSTSKKTIAERRHYARLVGNIDDDMYPILESAITGQINMADESNTHDSANDPRPTSLLDSKTFDKDQIRKLRAAMLEREGLIASIFELLRIVPRRMLMILKLSDLQRSLDQSLATTHGQSRVFVIVARYCAKAIWQADYANFRKSLSTQGFSLSLFKSFINSFFDYAYWNTTLGLVELGLDARARSIKIVLWFDGLVKGGLKAAEAEMAGLSSDGAIPATA
ncbi:Atypical/ABC1/ABC1-B protein kinase [Cryptococcus neoformans]|uniref:AarF domain-containing kinase n=1 Tax=Cryptococcus neoformans Tu259-1 TaxID=1230072 RepID=A0A854Q3X3_CRYNE|nr:aarF domain-containing kinase [Cryptococcus neoformans var. grubii AD1-83a]OXG13627.1 aarF domain-containing kinase [Cryptococcus neoformans var. grubii Tu259-1]OXG51635.1 aarF domain-containing kinase [Cryptococcus neoformans var. grubii MW-RSA1955]OXG53491.1 aarF domain-containing kinase [Cryptococcus neoformans var. grubii Th84]OXG55543.1 aarF domain-containing kinase [Cryptococcus neoformans var. grubii CHC193]OXG65794.1 aarF domain-containing kinase [Cryptococcus neoformans var. grubii